MTEFDRIWRSVLMSDPCVYCGGAAAGLDHIVPKTVGGQNNWTNRAPACRPCDQDKGNIPLLLYLWATDKARRRLEYRIARRAREGHPRLTDQQKIATLAGRRRNFLNAVRQDEARREARVTRGSK